MWMRGEDLQQNEPFSYGSLEQRVPANHPLRPIQVMLEDGRKSIPPERLLQALLLQLLYSIRSKRMLLEQMEYNLPCSARQYTTTSGFLSFP
jgi:transposase